MTEQDAFRDAMNAAGPEFGAQPFWFWNGKMDPDEMRRQIAEMDAKGVTGFVIHARLGLEIEYLGETWFDRVALALEEAKARGMRVWIYDEENWPSGYAGGRVLAAKPNLTPQCLEFERVWLDHGENLPHPMPAEDPCGRGEVMAVVAVPVLRAEPRPRSPLDWYGPNAPKTWAWHNHIFQDIELGPDFLRLPTDADWDNPGGRWMVAILRRRTTEWFPAYSHERYVDVLHPETAPAFLASTHDEYARRFPEYFGNTIVGFFVDEPGLYHNFWDRNVGSVAWTEDFAEAFQAAKGYDILDEAIKLWERLPAKTSAPSYERVRFDFYDFVGELMQKRFMRPQREWCEAHGVEFTGHLMLEEFLHTMARYAGNPFRQLRELHVPGVDRIDEVYEKVTERLGSSIAHLAGRKRVISESFALTGWKLAPLEIRKIVDHQVVRGVNLISPHAFYYSIEGFRKDECPPSEFFQNPWWEYSKPLWDYIRKLCWAASQGKPKKQFLLYYPLEACYSKVSPEWPRAAVAGPTEHWQLSDEWHPAIQLDQKYIRLVVSLEESGFDFDLIDHTFLAESEIVHGDKPLLRCGDVEVDTLVFAYASVVSPAAAEKAQAFEAAGGRVIRLDSPMRDVDGAEWRGRAEDWGDAVLRLLAAFWSHGPATPLATSVPTTANPTRPKRFSFFAMQRLERDVHGSKWQLSASLRSSQLDLVEIQLPGGWVPLSDSHADFEGWKDVLNLQSGWTIEGPNGQKLENAKLADWSTLGWGQCSGTATYSIEFDVEKFADDAVISVRLLEAGRITLNGHVIGDAAISDFESIIGPSLKPGKNELVIEVASSLAGVMRGEETLVGLLEVSINPKVELWPKFQCDQYGKR